jgi:thiamine-monophosphate kinase
MAPRRAPARDRPLDESRFHDWLARSFPGAGQLPLGDDAAAIPIGRGRSLLLTTDALSEGWHFRAASPARSVGAAAASVSLSDIAAKGGRPIAFLLDLLLPPSTPEGWAQEVSVGAEQQLARFGAHLVGGDTKPARQRAVVGTLIGETRSHRLVPRSAARHGDVLVVTGAVGRGGHDLLAVRRRGRGRAQALARILDIHPRVVEGALLAGHAHAMMDTSDGFADSAALMAKASGVRLNVAQESLPLYPRLIELRLSHRALWSAAFLGGDYELLAAVPATRVAAARRALLRVGCPLAVVGRVERGRGAMWSVDGHASPMPSGTWRPFARRR